MLEILSSIVANGTAAFDWGYQPWLPFDNFLPIIGFVAFLIYYMGGRGGKKIGWIFLNCALFSLIPTWLVWNWYLLGPGEIFRTWLGFTLIITGVGGWLSMYRVHRFDQVEEYLEHIRAEHPELWEDIEKEVEKDNAD